MAQQKSSPKIEPIGGETSKQAFIRPEAPWTFVLWFLIGAIVVILAIYAVYAGV